MIGLYSNDRFGLKMLKVTESQILPKDKTSHFYGSVAI